MECAVGGSPVSSPYEGGICARCSDKDTSDAIYSGNLRRSLTRKELDALRSELDDLVNE